jgi:hypothetical protein
VSDLPVRLFPGGGCGKLPPYAAGLTVAAVPAQRGWKVRVHEQGEGLREIGAGIYLFETAPTRFAAHATSPRPAVQGMIATGLEGDLAVYRDDPLATPAEELTRLEADPPVVAGRIVHRVPGAPA